MHHFRNALGILGAATALTLAGVVSTGTAHAQPTGPASLYAPSALVLAVGEGEDAATATVTRAVTLSCAPSASGTHPSPESACAELAATGGEFSGLIDASKRGNCTRQWDPVVVTAEGVWQGKRVSWSATFGNACEMRGSLAGGSAFTF